MQTKYAHYTNKLYCPVKNSLHCFHRFIDVKEQVRFAGRFDVLIFVKTEFLCNQISFSCGWEIIDTKVRAIDSDQFWTTIVALCQIDH